uniref:Peptidase M16 N-terminal domain-containing protein n=1 Tax=Picocystis salinarum TaxID=88271 RepID=A0A7S3UFZ3_9CHLO
MEGVLPSHPRLKRIRNAPVECWTVQHEDTKGMLHVYLEVRSGSAHERDDQQGMAHLVEHAVFLGTKDMPDAASVRVALANIGASMGADSNAFTDYLQTVYTLRCPCASTGMEQQAETQPELEKGGMREGRFEATQVGRIGGSLSTREIAPAENVAYMPTPRRNAKEVLTDALKLLHQFAFHANLPSEALSKEIQTVISELQMRNTCDYRAEVEFMHQVHPDCYLSQRFPIGLEEQLQRWTAADVFDFYQKHYRANNMRLYVVSPLSAEQVRETVMAAFQDVPGQRTACDIAPVVSLPCTYGPPSQNIKVHRDPLHTDVSITVCSLTPLHPLRSLEDVRLMAMDSILQMALDLRLEALIEEDQLHSIIGAGWDFMDSFQEGCGILTFSLTASKEHWPKATRAVFSEVAKMYEYGLGVSEFKFCCECLLRDAEIDAEQIDSKDGGIIIEDLLDAVCLEEAFMDDSQLCQLYKDVLPTIRLEDMNARAGEMLAFVVNIPRPSENNNEWERQNMTKAGSVFACIPRDLPAGIQDMESEQLLVLLSEAVEKPSRSVDLDMPEFLISPEELEEIVRHAGPQYVAVPLKDGEIVREVTPRIAEKPPEKKCRVELSASREIRVWDPSTEITRMKLSNGLNLVYRQTAFEKQQVSIKVVAWGGRAMEEQSSPGSVSLGLQTLMEGGAGSYSADMVGRYAHRHGCEISGLSEAENIWVRAEASVSSGGLQRAFELLRLFVACGSFEQKAFSRSKENYRRAYEALQRDVTGSAASAINELISSDSRFLQPPLDLIDRLTLEECKQAVLRQFSASNMEIVVVGDFDAEALEALVLRYFGAFERNAVSATRPIALDGSHWQEIDFRSRPAEKKLVIPDEAKRCVLCMAMPTCNHWGMWPEAIPTSPRWNAPTSDYDAGRMRRRWLASVLFEIANLKLFTIVREQKGLAYDISLSSKGYAYVFKHGLLTVRATPHPEEVEEVVRLVKRCVEGIRAGDFTSQDIEEAIRPMISSVASGLKTNEYWLKSMQGLSLPFWPTGRESVCGAIDFLSSIQKSQLMQLIPDLFPSDLTFWTCSASGAG